MTYWWAIGLGAAAALALSLTASACSAINPTPSDVLQKFCTFHSSQIAQVLFTPEQLKAGAIVCNAVGARLGVPD